MRKKRIPGIKGRVNVKEAHNSTIVGVQVQLGPDQAQMDQAVKALGSVTGLLQLQISELKNLSVTDSLGLALFACESETDSTLGFAVNNSGLIVCPTVVGRVGRVRQLTTSAISVPEVMASYSMLQALKIKVQTKGLIPSYRYYPEFHEQLYAFDSHGGRCQLDPIMTHLTAKIQTKAGEVLLTDAFAATFKSDFGLVGGPVLNAENEVMGIAVATSSGGDVSYLYIQPWSKIERCIRMDWEPFEPASAPD